MVKSNAEQAFYDAVWDYWTPPGAKIPFCIVCLREAVTLHEIRPRSVYPEWMEDWFNSVPICNECHERVTNRVGDLHERLVSIRDARHLALRQWVGDTRERPDIRLSNRQPRDTEEPI